MRLLLAAALSLLTYLAVAQCIGCDEGVRDGAATNTAPTTMSQPLNVFGTELQPCSLDPMTGWFRDGSCHTNDMDHGTHVVCARVTKAFLEYSATQGNDLMTPRPEYRFSGLKDGDQWCLCALRWREAHEAGVAPPVVLESTHQRALEYVTLNDLRGVAVE